MDKRKGIEMHEYRKTQIVKTEVVEVSPTKALEMLSNNIDNRKLKTRIVKVYANDMRNDLWVENGETILVTEDGSILNGQHRLSAVIASSKTIRFLVATAAPIDGKGKLTPMDVIQDRGSIRSHTDISGISRNCDTTSAIMIRDLIKDGQAYSVNTMFRTSIYEAFKDEMDYLFSRCPSAARFYSRASIRCIIALRLAQGYDFTEDYHSILGPLTGLSASWMSWYRRIGSIKGVAKSERMEMMAATWVLTEPDRDMNKAITLRDISGKIEEIRDVFYSICGETIKEFIPNGSYKR